MSFVKEQKEAANRLNEFITHVNMSKRQFASELGYVKYTAVRRILMAEGELQFSFVQRLIKTFPKINLNWLYSGRGEMLNKPLSISDIQKTDKSK